MICTDGKYAVVRSRSMARVGEAGGGWNVKCHSGEPVRTLRNRGKAEKNANAQMFFSFTPLTPPLNIETHGYEYGGASMLAYNEEKVRRGGFKSKLLRSP